MRGWGTERVLDRGWEGRREGGYESEGGRVGGYESEGGREMRGCVIGYTRRHEKVYVCYTTQRGYESV